MPRRQSTYKVWFWKTKKSLWSIGRFILKHSIATISIIVWLWALMWLIIAWYYWLRDKRFIIQTVDVSLDPYAQLYKDPLSSYLKKDFGSMSIVELPRYTFSFGRYYRSQHKRVKSIHYKREWNKLFITVAWHKPHLIIHIDDEMIALVWENNESVGIKNDSMKQLSGATTGDWKQMPQLELLIHQKNDTWYQTMFYEIPPKALIQQITLIDQNISWYSTLSWIPWSHKLSMKRKDNKVFYFDLTKNIIEQLDIYRLITWSWNISSRYQTIDLGTMDNMIFMK